MASAPGDRASTVRRMLTGTCLGFSLVPKAWNGSHHQVLLRRSGCPVNQLQIPECLNLTEAILLTSEHIRNDVSGCLERQCPTLQKDVGKLKPLFSLKQICPRTSMGSIMPRWPLNTWTKLGSRIWDREFMSLQGRSFVMQLSRLFLEVRRPAAVIQAALWTCQIWIPAPEPSMSTYDATFSRCVTGKVTGKALDLHVDMWRISMQPRDHQ